MTTLRLENEYVRIELDSNTGGFRSIFDKKCQYEYVTCPDRALLFRLMAPEREEHFLHLDARDAQASISAGSAALKYQLEGIEAEVTLSLDSDVLLAELRIANKGTKTVEEVMFPWVRGIGPVPEGELVWPYMWGRRYKDVFGDDLGGDHHTWNEWTQKAVARYPCHLTSAWCNFGNARHGLALEGRHSDFSIMDFFAHKIVEKTFEPVRRSLDLCTVHPRRIKPGESYVSSPVQIRVHQGDWHPVADSHRAWLETWIKKPQRPAKFAESIGWHFFFMKHQDGLVLNRYEDLPAMARAALDAGCPYLLVFGWQTGGHDNNYFYRYTPNEQWGGAEAIRAAVDQCRAIGVEIMPFFNGTLANTELPEHKEFGYRWEAKTRSGHPYYAGDWARHNFDALTRNRAMLHTEIAFCKEQREYFLATVKRIVQEYGFGNLQLDQIAEKMLVDYNEEHITSTPDRVYVDGLAELLPEVRRLVREKNSEGVMISESLNDFTGQWCDSSWDWGNLMRFPEPILFTLPWLMGSHEIDANEYDEVNKAFVYKLHLDMKIDGGDAPISKYPAFAAHVKSLAALRRRIAGYYVYADFRDQEGIECDAPEGVLARVYRNTSTRKLGVVIAETKREKSAAIVTLKDRAKGSKVSMDSNQRPPEDAELIPKMRIDLNPHEVRVLMVDLE